MKKQMFNRVSNRDIVYVVVRTGTDPTDIEVLGVFEFQWNAQRFIDAKGIPGPNSPTYVIHETAWNPKATNIWGDPIIKGTFHPEIYS